MTAVIAQRATARIRQLVETLGRVRTIIPLVLDRGARGGPYCVRTWDGLQVWLRPGRGDRRGFYEVIVRGDYLAQGQVIRHGAEPESFRQLVANVEHNRLSNVTMRAVAIGLSNGTALLRTSGTALYSSTFESVDGRRNAGRSSAVQVRTLETMMREMAVERCHYLTMDCEGSEYEIVDSLSVNVASRIDQITLETHEVPGRSVHELSRRLRALGFRLDSGPLMYARRGVSSEMPREAPQTV